MLRFQKVFICYCQRFNKQNNKNERKSIMYFYKYKVDRIKRINGVNEKTALLKVSPTKIDSHEKHEQNLQFIGGYDSVTDFLTANVEELTSHKEGCLRPFDIVDQLQKIDPEITFEKILIMLEYNRHKKSQLLKNELNMIQDKQLRSIVRDFLDTKVPDYFWEIPASSSGKYHPSFDAGHGGLVRHTQMVVEVAAELMRLDRYNERYKEVNRDVVYAACILHDAFKNGTSDSGHTVFSHPSIAADEFYSYAVHALQKNNETDSLLKREIEQIHSAVDSHMGQWGTREIKTSEGDVVFMADYIASRKFFDKFPKIV